MSNNDFLNLINNINSKIDNSEPIVAYKNNDNNTIESILVHPEDIENIDSVSEVSVAEKGYGLNKLIKDHSANVRKAVKNQGYYSFKNIIKRFINKLFSYEDKNNYTDYNYIDPKIALLMIDNLSENNTENIRDLINCDDPYIRSMVAMKGYALDILVYDKDWRVREAVASTTTNLDLLNILLNDNDESVIKSAIKTVDKIHNYYINKN